MISFGVAEFTRLEGLSVKLPQCISGCAARQRSFRPAHHFTAVLPADRGFTAGVLAVLRVMAVDEFSGSASSCCYCEQMSIRVPFIVLVISAFTLTGCVTMPTPAVPDTSTTPEVAAVDVMELGEREYFPLPQGKDFRMPLLVGTTFGAVGDIAEELDFRIKYEDASEKDRVAWFRNNWTVVSQDPVAGTPMEEGNFVDVLVLKTDEAADAVADFLKQDRHRYEKRFTGTVTSIGPILGTFTVDDVEVKLDFIDLITDGCAWEGRGQASAAQNEVIWRGANVLVVRSDDGGPEGFMHVLKTADDLANVPAGSVNEALVRTGRWMPAESRFDDGFIENSIEGISTAEFVPQSEITGVQRSYAPLIAAAGNEGVASYLTGLGLCRANAEARVAKQRADRAESAEQQRLWSIEIDRRIREGYYGCRDGDGDGVCYER